MIYDAENTFFWHKELKSTTTASSDVVKTGTGDAVCPLDLYIQVTGASGGMTVKLETSKTAAMESLVTLGTYTVAKNGTVKAKLPYGDLGYLRLSYTGDAALTSGEISAALVMDVDLQ